jgi:PIN domain nuclease of toxin-antitoxin system
VRLLLDTHVVLWQLAGERELSREVRQAIEGADDLLFSVVSFAEIGAKAAIGKLDVPDGLDQHVRASGLRVLGLSPVHGLAVAGLPLHHRDPFDRLLIAQAITERLTVVTADRRFDAYPIHVVEVA